MPMYETRDLKEAWMYVTAADALSLPYHLAWPVDGKYMVYVNEDEKVDRPEDTKDKVDYTPSLEDRVIGFGSDNGN